MGIEGREDEEEEGEEEERGEKERGLQCGRSQCGSLIVFGWLVAGLWGLTCFEMRNHHAGRAAAARRRVQDADELVIFRKQNLLFPRKPNLLFSES